MHNEYQNTLCFSRYFYHYLNFQKIFIFHSKGFLPSQTAAIVPSIVYDNLAFGLFRPFIKMTRFCSTNNSSKKKWKNTSLLLYKYARIKITLLSKDNSWYSLILILISYEWSWYWHFITRFKKACNVTANFEYLVCLMVYFKDRSCYILFLREEGADISRKSLKFK